MRWRQRRTVEAKWPALKENAPCCVAERDKLGRLPIGFCSATCERMTPAQQRRRASAAR